MIVLLKKKSKDPCLGDFWVRKFSPLFLRISWTLTTASAVDVPLWIPSVEDLVLKVVFTSMGLVVLI